jgi:malto-oligosyltrehalose trehalohydrolase
MKRNYDMPFGAAIMPSGAVRFRLWAPAASRVSLRLADADLPDLAMQAEKGGWFSIETRHAHAGSRYLYVIDDAEAVPDPASRFQPKGVHQPSEVIDPSGFDWRDGDWRGRPWREAVIYELHVGTFTRAGDYAGAIEKLAQLADLGVTAIELMPLSEAPGRRNWGYDGAYPFAPESAYGRPNALRELVEAAHRAGLMVFLDVVYNHFGPEGNYLHRYAPQFFNDRRQTPWGPAINFDGQQSRAVRDFFIHNARYWLDEFHMDGLRLDAVHAIDDNSTPDFLTELAETVHRSVPKDRFVHLVLENDRNQARYLERDGHGESRLYAAQWNDDLHHALHVLLTGEVGGYYADYQSHPAARLGRSLTQGFDYQGEPSAYRGEASRGEPSAHLPALAFVSFLQNHDQIGNRALGDRIIRLTSSDALRAAMAIILLAPSPPLLFMGEEWGAMEAFPFFCDFEPELADAVRRGREREFAHFAQTVGDIPDATAASTFENAILDWSARAQDGHRTWLEFYRGLLATRHREIIPRLGGLRSGQAGYALEESGLLTAWWTLDDGSVLQLKANLSANALSDDGAQDRGRILFATHPDGTENCVPAWCVAWSLTDGGHS